MSRIAIIGAGPAGCATALALAAQSGHEVHLFEAGSHTRARIGESLAPDAAPLLQQLGVFEDFLRQGHAPCPGSAAAWQEPALGHFDYLSCPHGPGWHLDRTGFERWLALHAVQRGNRLHRQHRLQAAQAAPGGGYRLDFRTPEGERSHHFDWVVDAAGLAAPFATRIGVARHMFDELICLHVRFESAPAAFPAQSLIEATAYGWWYAARLPGDGLIVMLATDLSVMRALRLDQADRWLQALASTRELGPRLRSASPNSPMQLSFAATSQLDACTGPGWLAAGDAACSLDPICARGLHRALQQGCQAASALADGCSAAALTRYQQQLQREFSLQLGLQRALYAQQQRWPQSAFWQRRRALPALPTTQAAA